MTDGMPPSHVAPDVAEGIVLKKHVVNTIVINQTIGIIDPAGPGGEMKLWPKCLIILIFRAACSIARGNSGARVGEFGYTEERGGTADSTHKSPTGRYTRYKFDLTIGFAVR